jgi:hypothetical protein
MAISPVSALAFYEQPETLYQVGRVAVIVLIAYMVFGQASQAVITCSIYVICGAGAFHCTPHVLNFLKERFTWLLQ